MPRTKSLGQQPLHLGGHEVAYDGDAGGLRHQSILIKLEYVCAPDRRQGAFVPAGWPPIEMVAEQKSVKVPADNRLWLVLLLFERIDALFQKFLDFGLGKVRVLQNIAQKIE